MVSFIIPVFNDENNIGRCVQSIRNVERSKYTYEIIVLDNGSTDDTPKILAEFGIAFHVIPHVHVSALRNRGAAMAKGDILGFVDSDVELSSDWLTSAMTALSDQGVVACGCFPKVPHDATWVQRTWDIHQRGRQKHADSTPVAWLPSMNLMVRRDVFNEVQGFNENLVTAEDVDLCYRLEKLGTILNHPGMEAIHWGEAPDLATFWKKEVWRGLGNFSGLFSHGFRWDEVPSLIYPVYALAGILLVLFSGILDFLSGQVFWIWLGGGVLCLPPLILALSTAKLAKRFQALTPLFILYLVYGLARGYSLIKVFFHSERKTTAPLCNT